MTRDRYIQRLSKTGKPTSTKTASWVERIQSVAETLQKYGGTAVVYLLVDCSGSMSGDKIEQAKKGSANYAQEAEKKGYKVGLIRFENDADIIVDAKAGSDRVRKAVEKLSIGGSTNMASAIRLATNQLKRDGVICLVTDGMPDDKEQTVTEAEKAKRCGIEIMTIGTDDADKDFLAKLATRQELSKKVSREQLQEELADMAKLLPAKTME